MTLFELMTLLQDGLIKCLLVLVCMVSSLITVWWCRTCTGRLGGSLYEFVRSWRVCKALNQFLRPSIPRRIRLQESSIHVSRVLFPYYRLTHQYLRLTQFLSTIWRSFVCIRWKLAARFWLRIHSYGHSHVLGFANVAEFRFVASSSCNCKAALNH